MPGIKEYRRIHELKIRYKQMDITRISISGVPDYEETGDYEIEDKSADLEHNYFLEYDYNILNEVLAQLNEDDRKFIMMYFDDARENVSKVAKMAGIPRTTAAYRIDRILDEIRKLFFEKNPGETTEFFK